jgi:hypothetical protein
MKISVEKSKRIVTGILLASGATIFAGKVLECNFQDKLNFENETVKVQPFQYSTGKVIPQKGFWIVDQGPGARPGHIGGAIITPKSAANSWGAMYKDGKLNGAFSFFMSDSNGLNPKTPHNSIRPIDLDNRQKKGLRLVILNINNSIGCEMLSPKDGFIFPNGKKLNHFVFSGKAAMPPNAPCHIAVTFSTAADGMTTGKLYCKPGTDAIVPDKDKPQATIKFKLDPAVVKAGFFPGTFRYGKMTNIGKAPVEQRFARLTLYDSVQQELPGFDVKFATGTVEKKK